MLVALAAAVLGLSVAGIAIAQPSASSASAVTVTVDMTEYKFKLSKKTFKVGQKVTFKVKNSGDELHDFDISNVKKTKYLKPGQSQSITVTFKKKGKYEYLCTVGEHAFRGMTGKITVK
jgi:plastocyanin